MKKKYFKAWIKRLKESGRVNCLQGCRVTDIQEPDGDNMFVEFRRSNPEHGNEDVDTKVYHFVINCHDVRAINREIDPLMKYEGSEWFAYYDKQTKEAVYRFIVPVDANDRLELAVE